MPLCSMSEQRMKDNVQIREANLEFVGNCAACTDKILGARIIFGVLSALTWQRLRLCGTLLKRSTLVPCHEWIYTFHFIFLFEVATYLLPVLHPEDAKGISKSTFDSPSQWGIYLHYEKKQGPRCKHPFLRELCRHSTSGISTVVE